MSYVLLQDILPGITHPAFSVEYEDTSKYAFDDSFAENLYYLLDGPLNEFLPRLNNQIVIDLGAGNGDSSKLFSGITKRGVVMRGIVMVEPHNYASCHGRFFKDGDPDYAVAATDALGFLRALPDRSVSFLVSGIDGWLLPQTFYRQLMCQEMERTLHSEGLMIDHCSKFPLGGTCEKRITNSTYLRFYDLDKDHPPAG